MIPATIRQGPAARGRPRPTRPCRSRISAQGATTRPPLLDCTPWGLRERDPRQLMRPCRSACRPAGWSARPRLLTSCRPPSRHPGFGHFLACTFPACGRNRQMWRTGRRLGGAGTDCRARLSPVDSRRPPARVGGGRLRHVQGRPPCSSVVIRFCVVSCSMRVARRRIGARFAAGSGLLLVREGWRGIEDKLGRGTRDAAIPSVATHLDGR